MEYLENELVCCQKENIRLQKEIRIQKYQIEFHKKGINNPIKINIKSEHDESKMEREIMHLNKLLIDKDKEIVQSQKKLECQDAELYQLQQQVKDLQQ